MARPGRGCSRGLEPRGDCGVSVDLWRGGAEGAVGSGCVRAADCCRRHARLPRGGAARRDRSPGAAGRCRRAGRGHRRAGRRSGAAAGNGGGGARALRARVRRRGGRRADPRGVSRGLGGRAWRPMIRMWLAIAGIGGLASGIARGLGAHLTADARGAELLRTGALYGMVHAAALIAVIALAQGREPRRGAAAVAGWSFAAGIVLFSGSLFALAWSEARWLGWATPFGGAALLLGWAALATLAFRRR